MAADYVITRYMIYAFSIQTARSTDGTVRHWWIDLLILTETNLTLASNTNQRSQNEIRVPNLKCIRLLSHWLARNGYKTWNW